MDTCKIEWTKINNIINNILNFNLFIFFLGGGWGGGGNTIERIHCIVHIIRNYSILCH